MNIPSAAQHAYDTICKSAIDPQFHVETYKTDEYYEHCADIYQNVLLVMIKHNKNLMIHDYLVDTLPNNCIKMPRECDLWRIYDVEYKNVSLDISILGIVTLDNIIAEYVVPELHILANGSVIHRGIMDFYIPSCSTPYVCYSIDVQKTPAVKCSIKIKIKKMMVGLIYRTPICDGKFFINEKLLVDGGLVGGCAHTTDLGIFGLSLVDS